MSKPAGTPFDQGPLAPENVTARLLVLEFLILNITATLKAAAARQNGLTLDGIRNRLAAAHSQMLDGLLETNQGAFDAGVPYATSVSHKLFGAVKVMLQTPQDAGTTPSSTEAKKLNCGNSREGCEG